VLNRTIPEKVWSMCSRFSRMRWRSVSTNACPRCSKRFHEPMTFPCVSSCATSPWLIRRRARRVAAWLQRGNSVDMPPRRMAIVTSTSSKSRSSAPSHPYHIYSRRYRQLRIRTHSRRYSLQGVQRVSERDNHRPRTSPSLHRCASKA